MKITLFALNGSYAHTALGVRCLGDALRTAGYPVEIVEGNLHDRTGALLARLYEADAALYGFSCYIWNIEQMLAIAENLKALRPDCRIVLGGPEVSFATERFTSLPFVDHVITGEGEEAIVALAGAVSRGEQLPRVIKGVPDPNFEKRGIHYAKNDPVPPLVYYESSRGCPFCCAFCLSSATRGVRAKSAEQTIRELAEFEEIEGDFTIKLVDRTFNFDIARAKQIWRALLSPAFTKCYHFEVAAHLLDEESFQILAQFPKGKVRLEIGLQSTNEKTLAAISRHTEPAAVLSACARLMRDGACHVHLDLIAGLPHEDFASFGRSFDAAYPHCHVLQLGFLKLLHGTALRARAAEFGAICEQKPPYTVLCTDALSFAEMMKLHAVDELMERLRGKGRFLHTLDFLLPRLGSPFAFYCDFSAHLRDTYAEKPLQSISQRDLFWQLACFARARLAACEHEALSAAMRADYAEAETRRPPRGL